MYTCHICYQTWSELFSFHGRIGTHTYIQQPLLYRLENVVFVMENATKGETFGYNVHERKYMLLYTALTKVRSEKSFALILTPFTQFCAFST